MCLRTDRKRPKHSESDRYVAISIVLITCYFTVKSGEYDNEHSASIRTVQYLA